LKLALLAASSELRLFERELIFELTKKDKSMNAIVGDLFRLLKMELDAISQDYDFVLVDCAPGISAVTEASIRLADLVIIPTIPDYLSTYGLEMFCATLWKHDEFGASYGPKRLPYVLATRARQHITSHAEYLKILQSQGESNERVFELFQTVIPEAAAISFALSWRMKYPTFRSKWGPKQTALFEQLALETLEALNEH
jgi:chromosome partitioning protein